MSVSWTAWHFRIFGLRSMSHLLFLEKLCHFLKCPLFMDHLVLIQFLINIKYYYILDSLTFWEAGVKVKLTVSIFRRMLSYL